MALWKYSFLDSPRTRYALVGGAAAAGALVLVTGESEDSVPASTTTSPVSTPSPVGTTPSTDTGVAACAGVYNASFVVQSDAGGHRRFVGMPQNMNLEIGIASIHVRGTEPFVEVNGTIDGAGNFDATGSGTVAGRNGVTVRMNGTLRGCGEGSGELSAQYSMGVGGELPSGEPITYDVSGRK